MTRVGERDLEGMDQAGLAAADRAELVEAARECTFLFTDDEGWPAGVTMSHLFHEGVFWLTAVRGRAHVTAAERNPRVGLVISNLGTGLPGRRMVRIRGRATVHRDRPTLDAVLPLLARRLQPRDPDRMLRLLDSPRRVLIRVEPVSYPQTHDSRRIAGDGRGGPARTSSVDPRRE
ncbi:pyridoxamine 5'-phosphate oxidase family protein [Pseudonocardia lutea]|uniref:Pyridoxamine 5'-phosphate oxidase family protein n=1 Tax=Pseudonocardia lutea TaxID=2172015 RepID=A0ABW1III3_9PSEU